MTKTGESSGNWVPLWGSRLSWLSFASAILPLVYGVDYLIQGMSDEMFAELALGIGGILFTAGVLSVFAATIFITFKNMGIFIIMAVTTAVTTAVSLFVLWYMMEWLIRLTM